MPQFDGHQMKTQFRSGVRERGRGRGRGREQGRGEGRGRSGVGGHRSGCNKGNGLEFVDSVMSETMAGSGVVGSVSGGDVNAKGVGGTSGGGGGGSSLTITREKQKLTNKVQVVGARRVWGTMKVTSTSSLKSTIQKFCPLNSLQIKRKTVLDVAGNVRKWWFIIHAPENVLLDLEGSWDQLQLQTGWKLEPRFKPADPVSSNVNPQICPIADADADVVLPARDSGNNQATQESLQDHNNYQASLESVQDHNSNQASLESCQTSFLWN